MLPIYSSALYFYVPHSFHVLMVLQISFALLTLIPGLCESIAVCVMFSTRFKQWELSVVVLIGVIFYTVITRVVTTRRKERRYCTKDMGNM